MKPFYYSTVEGHCNKLQITKKGKYFKCWNILNEHKTWGYSEFTLLKKKY